MLGWAMRLLVVLAMFVILAWFADIDAIWARLVSADWVWLALVLGLMLVATALMALRWAGTARMLGLDIGYGHALREYFYGQLVNQLVPGGVVGDGTRALRLRQAGDLKRAAQSVILERAMGQIILGIVTLLGFACVTVMPGGLGWPLPLGISIGLMVAAMVALGMAWLYPTCRSALRLLGRALWDVRQIALSLLIALCLIGAFYAAARATGTQMGLAPTATLIPLILTAMVIPLSVAGWGWREGAAAALFPIMGASVDAGIAASVAYGALMLISAVPAIVFYLLAGSKHPEPPQKPMEST